MRWSFQVPDFFDFIPNWFARHILIQLCNHPASFQSVIKSYPRNIRVVWWLCSVFSCILMRDFSFYWEVSHVYIYIYIYISNFCVDRFSFINRFVLAHLYFYTSGITHFLPTCTPLSVWPLLPLQPDEHHCLPLLSATASSFPQYQCSFFQGLHPTPLLLYFSCNLLVLTS
jgi:hypothetical protein